MANKKKYEPTAAEKITALTLEARRLGKSYGELSHELKDDGRREYEIISAYIAAKQEKKERRARNCAGCAYYVRWASHDNQRMCSFSQEGRLHKEDAEGNCLDFTTKKLKARHAPTKFQQLINGDWSEKTVTQIARELDTPEKHVHEMLSIARRRYGVDVAFKRIKPDGGEG